MNTGKNVQMILNGVDPVDVALPLLENSLNVAKEVVAAGNRLASLCGKDNVVADLCIGRHPGILLQLTPASLV